MIKIIAAVDNNWGIGKDGKLPWEVESELRFFRETTFGKGYNAVVMGSVTAKSLPTFPLKGRENIVFTSSKNSNLWPRVISSAYSILDIAAREEHDDIFIIGGAILYNICISYGYAEEVILSRIPGKFECDRFIDEFTFNMHYTPTRTELKGDFSVEYYKRRRNPFDGATS
jgi:dihydrofolate reductase